MANCEEDGHEHSTIQFKNIAVTMHDEGLNENKICILQMILDELA